VPVEAPRKVSVSKQSELSFRPGIKEESKINLMQGHVLITDDMFLSKNNDGKRVVKSSLIDSKPRASDRGTKRKQPKLSIGSESAGKLSAFFSKKSPV
jgi:hypothetical protein